LGKLWRPIVFEYILVVLFFSAHNPALAFYGLVSLWSMIVVNIYYFSQIKKAAAWLLVPYILWVTFAVT
jgi:tryptophan-rich sensory protein